MNVILCGFMGCGKSTIGKIVAEKINYDFIDLDDYITQKRSMSINEIFEKYGEENFRKSETQAVKNISELNNCVVALGGGTVINPENAKALKVSGKLFFLNASANTIYDRLKNDTKRPLLQTDDKLKVITDMMNKRLPFYLSSADVVIEIDGKNEQEIVREICKSLN